VNLLRVTIALLCLGAYSLPAIALTAVCRNPTGRILGIHGKALGGKEFDEPDGISQATFTLIWKPGTKEAQLVSQRSGGGAPETTKPLLIFDTDEQLTFVVLYESAVWFYSLYVGPKALIMTSHNNGASIDSGGAVVKSFIAKCEIGE
jgi:hypothetical protein